MAKPLGPKSRLIREAITKYPGKGNTELAEMLTGAPERKDDKIKVTAQDVATQRQAMKKPGAAKAQATAARAAGNGGRKPGRKPAVAAPRAATAPAAANPVDLIDRTLALAQECGGVEQLRRLVERLAGMRAR